MPVKVIQGNSPVILSMPHTGVEVPHEILQKLNTTGQTLADTDWHVHQLYADLLPQATLVRATFHRYVIDANRGPADESLYPGQNTTGLCPVTDFDGQSIYRSGCEPNTEEIEHRRKKYHQPYHEALTNEIERVHQQHGIVVLCDCHSIRSILPFLFNGILPDFNIGTNDGKSCDSQIEKSVIETCKNAENYNTVLNGRFKGGWTTRHYANQISNIHAIQIELAQSAYMQEVEPWLYLSEKAEKLRQILSSILNNLEHTAYQLTDRPLPDSSPTEEIFT